MAKGRPPKPVEQHILSGTFRGDRHTMPAARQAAVPSCPKHLGKDEKKVWGELVKALKEVGTQSAKADLLVMENYVDAVVMLRAAKEQLKQLKMSAMIDDEGSALIKKLYVIVRGEREAVTTLGALLGLDPVTRTRLSLGCASDNGPAAPAVRGPELDLPPPEVG